MTGSSTVIFEKVTSQIISLLEKGIVPWRRPWTVNGAAPKNALSKKPYNGTNRFVLMVSALEAGYSSPYWGTYKQVQELGGTIRKGEHGTPIIFAKPVDRKDQETGEIKTDKNGDPVRCWIWRYSTVFNIEQTTVPAPEDPSAPAVPVPVPEDARAAALAYLAREKIEFSEGGDRASYRPITDSITVPAASQYTNGAEYLSTIYHEIVHSTGIETRLNRYQSTDPIRFGNEVYAKEELVAEIGAAFCCAAYGIDQSTIENSTAYIGGWLKALKNDRQMVITAASAAEKACKFIIPVEA